MLIAIHQSDAQYLIDQDIFDPEVAKEFDFSFSDFKLTPVMLACAVGE